MARDWSKTAFVAGALALLAGGSLVLGMASVKRDMGLYRTVWGTLDSAKTLVEELPNLRGTEPIHFLVPARHAGQGVTVNDTGGDDLILMSGFLGDGNKARLMRRDGTVLAEWAMDAHAIYEDPSFFRLPPMTDWNAITHGTIITPEGDIVFSFESGGLVRMDRCGKVLWASDEITHHSPNWLADGGIVVSGGEYVTGKDTPWPYRAPYWEDLVYRFDKDGNRTFAKALTTLFNDNGLQPLLTSGSDFRTRIDGEFHLNEVEELSAGMAADFPMFAAGDLLLSLRNLNMILVTDAKVERIKWWKIGPFIRQHDPDFQKGGKITVFDNHSDETRDGSVTGGSRVWEIDVASGEARTLYGGRDGQRFSSPERSTHQVLANGNLMVTAAQEGRAFEVTPAGKIVWEYVNRWDETRALWLHDTEVFEPGYFRVTDWSCPVG
jgi:hypothetical protein